MTNKKQKMKIVKLALFVLFLALLVFLTIKLLPLFKDLGTDAGRIAFKDKINQMGILGPIVIMALILVQMLIAFLPGEPLEILAGMCYGTIGGTLLTLLAVFIGSSIIFFSVKKFGKDFIITFFGEENYQKIQNNKIFKNVKKVELVLFILFFIPGTPKDLFTYLGGLIPIKPFVFLMISTFARFPSIITSTFAGSNIIQGNFDITIITFIVTIVIAIIGIFIYYKISQKYNK